MADARLSLEQIGMLVREVANHLPGFAPSQRERASNGLTGPDGMALCFIAEPEYRVLVSGTWPLDGGRMTDPHALGLVPRSVRLPAITFPLGRHPASIAQEIARRFLPEYQRLYYQSAERTRANEARRANRREAAEQLATALGTTVSESDDPDRAYQLEVRGTAGQSEIHGVIQIASDTDVRVELSGVSVEAAIALLRPVLGRGTVRSRLG